MKIKELSDDQKKYLKTHSLEKKYQKASEYFEQNPNHPSLNIFWECIYEYGFKLGFGVKNYTYAADAFIVGRGFYNCIIYVCVLISVKLALVKSAHDILLRVLKCQSFVYPLLS